MTSSIALSTQPFEATRNVLNTIDSMAFEPMCKIDVLATIPRLAQTAINSIGLADSAISTLILCLASVSPMPEAYKSKVKVWRDDAWNLTCQLADEIARLIIAAIPFAGTHILSRLDHYTDSYKSISGELDGLRATGLAHDSVIAKNVDTIRTLRDQIRELDSALAKLEQLKKENAGLQQIIEREKASHTEEKESLILEHRARLQQAFSMQEQLQHELDSAQDLASKLSPENSSLKEKLQSLQDQLQAVTRSHESCASTLEEAQKATERVRSELTQEKKKAASTVASLETKLGQVNKELSEEKSAKSSVEQRVADLERRIATLTHEKASLTSKNKELREANAKLHTLRASSPKAPK